MAAPAERCSIDRSSVVTVPAPDHASYDVVRPDLRAWRTAPEKGPVVWFALTFLLWVAALAIGLWSPRPMVRVIMVVPLTLASAQMFTLGHDAGHGSFSTSRTVNAVVGRLAFVPSVHVFGLWRHHHDIHHRWTNLRGRDFVWTPLTVHEYRALPEWRRTLHRICRQQSGLGLGLHYAVEIWAPRMLWPRARHDLPRRGRLIADALLLYGVLMGLALLAWWFIAMVEPDRLGDAGSWASAVLSLFVVPLAGTQWLIGFVIYLNHTHPEIVWYDDSTEWSHHAVQLEGSAGQRFRRFSLLPQRIMHHTAHHVDPSVPLRQLEHAQHYLVDTFGDRVVSYPWSRAVFRNILCRCKLYDYDEKRWLTYAAAEDDA